MKHLRLAVSCVALSLAGCASAPPPQYRFDGPGTLEMFLKARYECLREASGYSSSAAVNAYGGAAQTGQSCSRNTFNSCLAARGYLRNEASGRLTVPLSAVVYCQ